jgi:hypothetical protein
MPRKIKFTRDLTINLHKGHQKSTQIVLMKEINNFSHRKCFMTLKNPIFLELRTLLTNIEKMKKSALNL